MKIGVMLRHYEQKEGGVKVYTRRLLPLVSMSWSGDPRIVAEVRPLLRPVCRETVVCGALGQAMLMKLAVNLYLHILTVGLRGRAT